MSESRKALVLHLAGGGEPIWVAVSAQAAEELERDLPKLLLSDTPQTIGTVNGSTVVVNFSHVAIALLAPMPALASVYGK